MLAIGIILLIIGAILLVAPHAGAPPAAASLAALGWLLALAGVILIVVSLLVVGTDVDTESLVGGGLAMVAGGSLRGLHSAGESEAAIPVAGSVQDRQPVLVAFVVGAVPLVLAAAAGLADLFAAVPDWTVPTLTIIGTLTTGIAALWARERVTPVALPRLDDDTPLVPMTVREEV